MTEPILKKVSDINDYRKIAEQYFNKTITEDEMVHHIDGDHNNNDPENLVIMKKTQHSKVHVLFNFENWRKEHTKTLCNTCFFVGIYEDFLNKKIDENTLLGFLPIVWNFKKDMRIAEYLYESGLRWKIEKDHDCYLNKRLEVVPCLKL